MRKKTHLKKWLVILVFLLGLFLTSTAGAAEPNLVVWYEFDDPNATHTTENSGSFGSSHDGTLRNMAPGDWVSGVTGTALDFDGINDYVSIPPLNLNSNTVTISAWIKRDGEQPEADTGIVFCRDGRTVAGLCFGHGEGWTVNHHLGYNWNDDPSGWDWDSGLFIPDNEWVFVALVIEPTQATLYLGEDGTLLSATNMLNHDIEQFDGVTFIGYDWWSLRRYFKGTIDDVRIYNRALSAEDIASIAGPYEIAVRSIGDAIAEKEQMLEEVGRMLVGEKEGYCALEELLESGDYGDLKKGNIVKAKQRLRSAIQHQKQCGSALKKSIVKLEEALASLSWKPEQKSIKSKSFNLRKLPRIKNKGGLPNLDTDANGAFSQPYEIAVATIHDAIIEKEQMLKVVDETLEKEELAFDALEELLESGDYGDLKKGDIVQAKQKIHAAIQHEGQSQKKLEKSIERLQDALASLAWEPEQTSIKVMTFNMWGGGDSWDKCVEAIENSGADIIGLQEASNFVGIANSLGFYYDEGTWTLSRYPITAVQGWGYGQAVTIRLPYGQDVYVFNCHLPAYPYGPYQLPDVEAALEAELQAQWPALNPILLNMISYIATGKPCFLTGDFNVASHLDYADVPWKCSQECATAGLTDSYRSVHPDNRTYPPAFAYDEPGITWTPKPAQEPYDVYDRIDFVYFSGDNVMCTFSEELDGRNSVSPWPSDHRAVVSTFIIESPAPTTKATGPVPADGAGNVSINVDVSWIAGAGAVSHDVYFGTNPTPDVGEFQGNQNETSFEPGTLEYLTTYYWQIDEVSSSGTTTGDVWSFTTQDVKPELSLNKDFYIGGEPIFASFWNGPGNTTDWIGIYRPWQTPGSVPSTVWLYTNGTQWPGGSGPTDGSVEFNNDTGAPQWPLTEGDWVAYFLCCDGYTILAGPVAFAVE
jgi:endonuclease/exonuclease/phosphatase family metal-dependent hydrolase